MWGIGLRADDPHAKDPHRWRGKTIPGEALSAVHEAIRDSEAGSPHPTSPRRFRSLTGNAGIHEISSAQQSRLGTAVGADQGPPSAYFSDTPADQSPEVSAIASRGASDRVLPEHGSCLIGGTVTLDAVSFTTDIAIHSGGDAIAPYRCTALLHTGSPQTYIRRDVLDRMLSVGAASSACERPSSPRSWGGFGESAPLRTATHIRLSVRFFHENEPTCSLAVWASVVPPSVMQHAVLLGRDSWMRFNTRWYRALPPGPLDNRVLGELTLSYHATAGEAAQAVDPAPSKGPFHLRYDGTTGVILSDKPQLLAVNLVRSNGSPALTGHYLVDIVPQPNIRSRKKHFVASGQQVLPLTDVADLEPGNLVGVADAPRLRIPLGALQHPMMAAGPHPGQTSDSQVSAAVSLTDAEGIAHAVPPPSPTLMERLNPAQRSSFIRVWARLPPHLREITFDLNDPGWDLPTIEQLGDVICDFSDLFSTSKTDYGSCSLTTFEISVPEGSAPVTSRPHRVNPILAIEVDATLNQYLAAGQIQHSTSPYSSPLVAIPKQSGGVRITVTYKKLNQIIKLSQLQIPRVDQVLDSFGSGRVFSLFDLVSSFHQITAQKDTVLFTAFCIPTGLYE